MRKKETSYGVVPLRKLRGEWKTLLVKHGKGHWGFPKGHAEEGEEANETAARELQEETGLQVKSFLNIPPYTEHYFFRAGPDLIDKTVTYFAAEVEGKVVIQAAEITDFKWLTFEEAHALATFPEAKKLCTVIQTYLET